MRALEALESHVITYGEALFHFYIFYFPDGSPLLIMGPSVLPIRHIPPVFVPVSASMSDALILPFTFHSECFHLIGA